MTGKKFNYKFDRAGTGKGSTRSYNSTLAHGGKKKVAVRTRKRTATKKKSTRKSRSSSSYQGGGSGGAGPTLRFSHGRVKKVSKKFQQRVIEAASALNKWNETSAESLPSIIGGQDYTYFDIAFNSQLIAIRDLIQTSTPTMKYVLQDAVSTVTAANMSTGIGYLEIFECIPRRDVPNSLADPVTLLATGLSEAGTAGTKQTKTQLGTRPFSSNLFCLYFKIIKSRVIAVAPGENVRFTQSVGTRLIHPDILQTGNTSQAKGIAKFLLIRQWGGVVNDSTVKTNVSTDRTKFDYVQVVSYSYRWTQDIEVNTTYVNAMQIVATAAYINPDIDAPTTDLQA